MPRGRRSMRAGEIYHVLNRGVGRATIFHKQGDYEAFECIVREALSRRPLTIYDYCLMPNHWHFVIEPEHAEQASEFLQWMTMTHAQRYRTHYGSIGEGHVYQGRFKAFPVETEGYLLRLFRYVHRNPVRAGLVERAEQWPWSGIGSCAPAIGKRIPLAGWPLPQPENWLDIVNRPQSDAELAAIRKCIQRGRPYGNPVWVEDAAQRLGLEATLRARGRPRTSK